MLFRSPSSNIANSVHLFILCSSLCWVFFPVGILLQFSFLRAYCFFGCRYSKLFFFSFVPTVFSICRHSASVFLLACQLLFPAVGTLLQFSFLRAYSPFSHRHFAPIFPHSCLLTVSSSLFTDKLPHEKSKLEILKDVDSSTSFLYDVRC